MDGKQKFLLVLIGFVLTGLAVYFALEMLGRPEKVMPEDVQVEERTTATEEPESEVRPVEKIYVNVIFIGQNENKEEVYKAVKREYDKEIDGSRIKYAIHCLISGPKTSERSKGVYTEIPSATEIIYIKEFPDRVEINLNAEFEKGGGTDSLYKRLYQLIKTCKQNTDLPVYLYINGEKADVIGGEGIMLSQPLSDRSLDG